MWYVYAYGPLTDPLEGRIIIFLSDQGREGTRNGSRVLPVVSERVYEWEMRQSLSLQHLCQKLNKYKSIYI